MAIRKEALKNKEGPKSSETTAFKFPSMYTGFELHFHMAFFLNRIIENCKFTPGFL